MYHKVKVNILFKKTKIPRINIIVHVLSIIKWDILVNISLKQNYTIMKTILMIYPFTIDGCDGLIKIQMNKLQKDYQKKIKSIANKKKLKVKWMK